MHKRIILLFIIFNLLAAQDLTDYKICIDPGHGGHESNDRYIPATGFWESESNFSKALYLEEMLTNLGATVILTRYDNVNEPTLSQREAIANTNNVDFFHSIHSNGFQGTANYTLMLYEGTDSSPENPDAKEMAQIMGPILYDVNYTTTSYVRGDMSFLGYNLGVLNDLTMAGTLSEGSFHDYIPESWRLMNMAYRKHEAWGLARSFLEYYDTAELPTGIIAGVVRDNEQTVTYFSLSGDNKLPVNDLTVTLTPGDRVYRGDLKNNGFYFFDSLAPGDYKVIIEAPHYFKDSLTITVAANQTSFGNINLVSDGTVILPPVTPQNLQVLNNGSHSIRIKCDPASNADGYIVYYGTDGNTYPAADSFSVNDMEITGLDELQSYYFKVTAYNTLGESDRQSNLYGALTSANPENILIVNGFDRSTNTRHDYVKKYVLPLYSAGKGFSYVQNETVIAGKIALADYETVIWMLGDESTEDETFSSSEQTIVQNYLKQGGNFFVSGSEIGWDLEAKGTTADKAFYANYLKADYTEDSPGNTAGSTYSAGGISGSALGGISDFYFDDGNHGTFDVDWPDVINGLNGAENILVYRNVSGTKYSGIAYTGTFPGGTAEGKLIYLAVPFEAIYTSGSQSEIMTRVLDYFGYIVSAEPDKVVAEEFRLLQNYPNPFNPTTTIPYVLAEKSHVRLTVFNVNGQQVAILKNEALNAGYHETRWNAAQLSTGIYFYRLEVYDMAGNPAFCGTGKSMFVK